MPPRNSPPQKPSSRSALSRKPSKSSATRLRRFYNVLLRAYGHQKWWPADSPFEVVLGAYLTQNTSWRGVERSIINLREQGILSVAGIRATNEEDLRTLIRPSGYMIRKAAAIKAFVAFLDRDYAGSLDALAAESTSVAREKLLVLPGVGEETADAILLYALGHPVFVVDEYLRRIVTRHELLPPGRPSYADFQALATAAFAPDTPATLERHFNEFHALIVETGKRHCGPTPRCEACPLAPDLRRTSSGTARTQAHPLHSSV